MSAWDKDIMKSLSILWDIRSHKIGLYYILSSSSSCVFCPTVLTRRWKQAEKNIVCSSFLLCLFCSFLFSSSRLFLLIIWGGIKLFWVLFFIIFKNYKIYENFIILIAVIFFFITAIINIYGRICYALFFIKFFFY